jgi:two-component system KDP operon response regulator KdpE
VSADEGTQRSVLLIDDSLTETAIAKARLERDGYAVTIAGDGDEGLRALYKVRPDIVLLDVVMPGLDGWQTLERIREVSDVPVIMLTGRDTELERVRGLRGGADDYVGKPYSPAELAARVAAVLRRSRADWAPREAFFDGELAIDFDAREVRVRGEEVSLTPLEFRLLAVLTENAGLVLSRDQLLELVWGGAFGRDPDAVKLYIRYLRTKIERDPAHPELVETVRGFGYRYRKPPA